MGTATPTASLGFQNFFSALLTSDITDSDTDIPLDTIPNSSEGFLVIDPDSTTSREVIYYNSKTALKVTCPDASTGRGQDDTSASAHSTGDTVIIAPVAAYLEALQSGRALSLDLSIIGGLSNPYKFSVYRSSPLNITTSATKITFNTENFDTHGDFDNATNYRYTCPVNGFYQFNATAQTAATASRSRQLLMLYKNGSEYIRLADLDNLSGGTAGLTGSAFVQASAGDYFEIYSQCVGATAALTVSQIGNSFSGHLVSLT